MISYCWCDGMMPTKNIQGLSDNKEDLRTLRGIDITNFTLVDTISKGSQVHKKVIAQQVKEAGC